MRLIRNKIFRAIPELDRFPDEQCRHFVISANSSWRQRLLRWIAVGFAGLLSVIVAFAGVSFVVLELQNRTRADPGLSNVISIIVASVGIGIAMVATMVLRDYLLRLTIRRLIRRCGTCPKCQYTLLGMRVSPDHTVICPECGLKVDVDPALGDLSTDQTGAPVYKPEVARIHHATAETRRRRHRRFFKWTGMTIASVVLILAISAGIWWLVLNGQAKRALAERDGVARIHDLQIAMWPKGATANSAAEFDSYLALVTACFELQDPSLNPPPSAAAASNSATIAFDATTLIPGADAVAYDETKGPGSFAASRDYTLAMLDRARETGLLDRLRALLSLKAPIRDMVPAPSESFVSLLLPDRTMARPTARFNAARMIDAFNRADRAEYMQAMRETLAIAQIVERQGLVLDRMTAMAIRSLIIKRVGDDLPRVPDTEWVEDALTVLQRPSDRVALTSTLEIERLCGLDLIQLYFADPARVARAQLGNRDGLVDMKWSVRSGPTAIGSYERNRDAWNGIFASYSAAAAEPVPTKRPAVTVGRTGLALVDTLDPMLSLVLRLDDKIRYDYNHCLLTLASDLFRRKNGRFPTGPGEISPLLADRSVLNDPLTGKPFRFIVRDESGKDGRSFEIRSGRDDEPAPEESDMPAPDPERNADGSE